MLRITAARTRPTIIASPDSLPMPYAGSARPSIPIVTTSPASATRQPPVDFSRREAATHDFRAASEADGCLGVHGSSTVRTHQILHGIRLSISVQIGSVNSGLNSKKLTLPDGLFDGLDLYLCDARNFGFSETLVSRGERSHPID